MSTRAPAVAGTFYPAHVAELRQEIHRCLQYPAQPPPGRLRALVVPHAGYAYSGHLAGSALSLLAQIPPVNCRRVLLIGPSHHARFPGLASSGADSWLTPLGEVEVGAVPDALADITTPLPAAHAPEHCLEVEVPFLQMLLEKFTLVPLLTGRIDPHLLAGQLEQACVDGTFLVISSDLSHFYPLKQARQLDGQATSAILRLDPDELAIRAEACGMTGILALLHLARSLGWQPHLLGYATSADAGGDRSGVVGYGAYAFTGS